MILRPFTSADTSRLTTLLHDAYAVLGQRGLNFTAVDQTDETTLRLASGALGAATRSARLCSFRGGWTRTLVAWLPVFGFVLGRQEIGPA
jgi:hypothetical protein